VLAQSRDQPEQMQLVGCAFGLLHMESMNMPVTSCHKELLSVPHDVLCLLQICALLSKRSTNAKVEATFKKQMADPNLVHSSLSQRITVEGHEFSIEIYRLEHEAAWSLEVVDDEGTSAVWDDLFDTDQAALNEVLKAIEKEGLGAFRENADVIPFPKKPDLTSP
jgi:hypothetical protein